MERGEADRVTNDFELRAVTLANPHSDTIFIILFIIISKAFLFATIVFINLLWNRTDSEAISLWSGVGWWFRTSKSVLLTRFTVYIVGHFGSPLTRQEPVLLPTIVLQLAWRCLSTLFSPLSIQTPLSSRGMSDEVWVWGWILSSRTASDVVTMERCRPQF